MDEREIEQHFERSFAAYEAILGRAPRACGAAAWAVTPASLRVQDALRLDYASDLRGGPVCRLRAGDGELATPQIPTSGRCLEELLAQGAQGEEELAAALLGDLRSIEPAVLAVHAEVEGGPYLAFFDRLLPKLIEEHGRPRTLAEVAQSLERAALPVRELTYTLLAGRSGKVATSAEIPR
jgi:hypothetical protein